MMSKIQPRLSQLPHLVINSADFMRKTENLRLPHVCRFMKLDIKDFYMSGSHEDLVTYSSLCVDQEVRSDYTILSKAILASQYVSCSGKDIYRVKSGAGMGMLAPGHVADSAFYSMVEAPFVLTTSTRRKFGLFFYARFKDDIFIIFDASSGVEKMRDFVCEFRKRSGPFILKMESVSRHGCQMLDLFVSVGPSGRLMFSLFSKPTSIWQPLSLESCHPLSIHMHWPISQCNRIAERFSCSRQSCLAVSQFKTAYKEANDGVEVCEKRPFSALKLSTNWMVLPFDFSIGYSRVQQAISQIRVPSSAPFDRVKVSWSLANKHLMHLVRRGT